MWKVLAKSVRGTSHIRGEIPCQDACLTMVIDLGSESILIAAVADGAGSATHSDIGSRIACKAAIRIISDELIRSKSLPDISCDQGKAWFRSVLNDLEHEAASAKLELHQLACTLLVAVVAPGGSAFCQIGDGAIVVKDRDGFQHVFWPQSGEYANTTNFITSGRIDDELMFEWRHDSPAEIAIFTDGLQPVALNYADRRVHAPFFLPLFQAMRNHPEMSELEKPMQAFLESPQLADRTDDDLTLVLATRNPSDDELL